MDGLKIISDSLNALYELRGKEIIYFDEVDPKFQQDLFNFIVGRTLTMENERVVIGRNLYSWWLKKLNTRGFDYEIDFKKEYPPVMLFRTESPN